MRQLIGPRADAVLSSAKAAKQTYPHRLNHTHHSFREDTPFTYLKRDREHENASTQHQLLQSREYCAPL